MWIKKYYDEIESGNIIVGHEIKQVLKMILEDDRYYIDEESTNKRISFIEKHVKHTKSPFSGKPFKMALWQKALTEAIYGVKSKITGLRRFKKVILLVARKNGKSTYCSALAQSELYMGERGANICISSNDDSQANIIFEEIKDSISLSKVLRNKKLTKKNIRGIYNIRRLSKIFKITDKTKNKEGRNIDLGFLDESHEMKKNDIASSIIQSQSTKDEPLFINLTTEGFVVDGYLDEELRIARKVLDGEREDVTLLPWLYTQDSENEIWQDEKSWYKSNPSLGITKKVDYIKEQLNNAKESAATRIFVLAKDFNIKQNKSKCWLQVEDVVNEECFDIDDYKGYFYVGSFDLAETNDLGNARIMIYDKEKMKKFTITKYYIPEYKIKKNKEGIDYTEWVEKGYIDVTPGYENDLLKIANWFYELYELYDLKPFKIAFDRWHAKEVQKELEVMFGKDVLEAIPQSFDSLSDPMGMLEIDLKSKRMIYNSNPIDKKCLLDTAVEVNKYGQQRPIKSSSIAKIDGTLTMIMCQNIYSKYKNEIISLNEREM